MVARGRCWTRADFRCGSKGEILAASTSLPLRLQQRTFAGLTGGACSPAAAKHDQTIRKVTRRSYPETPLGPPRLGPSDNVMGSRPDRLKGVRCGAARTTWRSGATSRGGRLMVLRFYGWTGGGGRAKIRRNRRKNSPALLDLLNCATLLNSRSKYGRRQYRQLR
jgi:hypothetical protein